MLSSNECALIKRGRGNVNRQNIDNCDEYLRAHYLSIELTFECEFEPKSKPRQYLAFYHVTIDKDAPHLLVTSHQCHVLACLFVWLRCLFVCLSVFLHLTDCAVFDSEIRRLLNVNKRGFVYATDPLERVQNLIKIEF